jgi:hypothetical protein
VKPVPVELETALEVLLYEMFVGRSAPVRALKPGVPAEVPVPGPAKTRLGF